MHTWNTISLGKRRDRTRAEKILFPKRQILDSSKLKEFADDIVKFDENDSKFSNRVENTVGNEQFLLFPQCFLKTYTADT